MIVNKVKTSQQDIPTTCYLLNKNEARIWLSLSTLSLPRAIQQRKSSDRTTSTECTCIPLENDGQLLIHTSSSIEAS